jgi:2-polyprenyl-6-methoxyphenol hydroxylase-like FAD-dependent oxidoreductase
MMRLRSAFKANCVGVCRQWSSSTRPDSTSKQHNSTTVSSPSPPSSEPFDVIINGGGIVGLSFLLAAQKSPFLKDKRILLLERQAASSSSNVNQGQGHRFSNRVSSLTTSSRVFLDNLGVWSQLDAHSKRIDRMHVWSHDYHRAIRFRNQIDHSLDSVESDSSTQTPTDSDSVCHVTENDRILNALYSAIDQSQIRFDSEVTTVQADRNLVTLATSSGSTLSTKLLIGCDGFKSLVRSSCAFNYIERPLNQIGIVGTVRMDDNSVHSQNSIAYQRFLPSLQTVLALLPLDRSFCSLVLSTTPTMAKQCMQMSDEQFGQHLNQLLQMHSPLESNDPIKWVLNQFDRIGSNVVPEVQNLTSWPVVQQVESGSRAAFPLGFGTTLPNLVSSVRGNACLNVALIGKIRLIERHSMKVAVICYD